MPRTSVPIVCTLAALSIAAAPMAGAQTVAITGATVIDGTGRPPIPDAVVVMRDGRITALGAAREVTVPNDAAVISRMKVAQ